MPEHSGNYDFEILCAIDEADGHTHWLFNWCVAIGQGKEAYLGFVRGSGFDVDCRIQLEGHPNGPHMWGTKSGLITRFLGGEKSHPTPSSSPRFRLLCGETYRPEESIVNSVLRLVTAPWEQARPRPMFGPSFVRLNWLSAPAPSPP